MADIDFAGYCGGDEGGAAFLEERNLSLSLCFKQIETLYLLIEVINYLKLFLNLR